MYVVIAITINITGLVVECIFSGGGGDEDRLRRSGSEELVDVYRREALVDWPRVMVVIIVGSTTLAMA